MGHVTDGSDNRRLPKNGVHVKRMEKSGNTVLPEADDVIWTWRKRGLVQ